MRTCSAVALTAITFVVLGGPALAAAAPVPGPIAGIGLPAVALIGGAYWLGRKLLSRRD